MYLQSGDQDTVRTMGSPRPATHLVQDLAIPAGMRSQRSHAPPRCSLRAGRRARGGFVGLETVLYVLPYVGTVVAASEEGRPRAGVTMLVSFSLPLDGWLELPVQQIVRSGVAWRESLELLPWPRTSSQPVVSPRLGLQPRISTLNILAHPCIRSSGYGIGRLRQYVQTWAILPSPQRADE